MFVSLLSKGIQMTTVAMFRGHTVWKGPVLVLVVVVDDVCERPYRMVLEATQELRNTYVLEVPD